jgi:hypothetical protein
MVSRYRDEQAAPQGTATVEILPAVDKALITCTAQRVISQFPLNPIPHPVPHGQGLDLPEQVHSF